MINKTEDQFWEERESEEQLRSRRRGKWVEVNGTVAHVSYFADDDDDDPQFNEAIEAVINTLRFSRTL